MHESEDRVTEPDVLSFLSALPFVRGYAISIVSVMPGEVTIDLPFDERFSGPPGQCPASMVEPPAMWQRSLLVSRSTRRVGLWRRSTSR